MHLMLLLLLLKVVPLLLLHGRFRRLYFLTLLPLRLHFLGHLLLLLSLLSIS